jgi:hypothetical protein
MVALLEAEGVADGVSVSDGEAVTVREAVAVWVRVSLVVAVSVGVAEDDGAGPLLLPGRCLPISLCSMSRSMIHVLL